MAVKKRMLVLYIILLVTLVLGLFRLAYGIWFSNYISKRYGEILNINETYHTEMGTVVSGNQKMFKCEEDGINYICFSPLRFSGKYGNLQMYYSDVEDSVNEFNLLVIFNLFNYFGENSKEFSLRLYYLDESQQRRRVTFKLDSNKNIIDTDDISNYELELYDTMKPQIDEIYELLYERWPELNK